MKSYIKIILLLGITLSITFTSCKKREYVIKDAKLKLIGKEMKDPYNNVVNLYVNSNNETEGLVQIIKQSPDCPKAEHTYRKEVIRGVVFIYCEGEPLDCWVAPYNYNGKVINNAIWHCVK